MIEILVGSSGVAIERDREVAHEQSGHCLLPLIAPIMTRLAVVLLPVPRATTAPGVPDRRVGGAPVGQRCGHPLAGANGVTCSHAADAGLEHRRLRWSTNANEKQHLNRENVVNPTTEWR
jgi:hypothetical protein